jgi:hypothetical protein
MPISLSEPEPPVACALVRARLTCTPVGGPVGVGDGVRAGTAVEDVVAGAGVEHVVPAVARCRGWQDIGLTRSQDEVPGVVELTTTESFPPSVAAAGLSTLVERILCHKNIRARVEIAQGDVRCTALKCDQPPIARNDGFGALNSRAIQPL